MNLVYMDGKKEPYTTSEIIAECAEVTHHTIQELLRKHKADFESYGIIAFEMREELSKFRMQRALEKPKRKTLHDSIENWEQAPKHAHSTMNNLLLKAVTDRNAKQLREERGGYNGIDSLTSEELEQYQAFEDMVIAMIGLNMSYQEIKAMAFRNKKSRTQCA